MMKKSALFFTVAFLVSPIAFSQDQSNAAAANAPENLSNPATASNTLQPAGQIVWVSGTVKASYPEQTPRILTRGAMVYEKDTIMTEADGSGQVAFTDNSMITLDPKSILVIEKYYFDQKKPQQGGQQIMDLLKGGFRTVTGFVGKASPANYKMKTPVATIGVRGTDYQGSCPSNPGECAFALLHGVGLILVNGAGTFNVTPDLPYATIASFNTPAVLSKSPPDDIGAPPVIAPADAPPPSVGGGGGNCGILIN